MHVRFSSIQGQMVYEAITKQPLGTIQDILIHPVHLTIEGCFIRTATLIGYSTAFFLVTDIVNIGTSITINSSDCIGDVHDFIRLQSFVDDPRPLITAPVFTHENTRIGRVYDIQFQTSTFTCTWLFIKHWWRKQTIVCSSIHAVTPKGIYLKNTTIRAEEPATEVHANATDILTAELPVPAQGRRGH